MHHGSWVGQATPKQLTGDLQQLSEATKCQQQQQQQQQDQMAKGKQPIGVVAPTRDHTRPDHTIRYDTIRYHTIRYHTIQYDTIRTSPRARKSGQVAPSLGVSIPMAFAVCCNVVSTPHQPDQPTKQCRKLRSLHMLFNTGTPTDRCAYMWRVIHTGTLYVMYVICRGPFPIYPSMTCQICQFVMYVTCCVQQEFAITSVQARKSNRMESNRIESWQTNQHDVHTHTHIQTQTHTHTRVHTHIHTLFRHS